MANGKELILRPDAPVGNSAKDCNTLLQTFKGEFEAVLRGKVSVDIILKAAINSVRKNPKLLQCTQASMISSLMSCSETGLVPDTPLQECHLIPFKGQVTWIPGYRGYLKLARQSGEVGRIAAYTVYENDTFKVRYGSDPNVEHVPDLMNPGKAIHYYAIAYYKDERVPADIEVMTKEQVDKIRASSKAASGEAWTNHYDEMARKTVIRRLAKRLPLSQEMALAVDMDNAAAIGDPQPIHEAIAEVVEESTTPKPSKTESLGQELSARAGTETVEGEQELTWKSVSEYMDVHPVPVEVAEKYTDERLQTFNEKGLRNAMAELEREAAKMAEEIGPENQDPQEGRQRVSPAETESESRASAPARTARSGPRA